MYIRYLVLSFFLKLKNVFTFEVVVKSLNDFIIFPIGLYGMRSKFWIRPAALIKIKKPGNLAALRLPVGVRRLERPTSTSRT